MLRQLLFFSTFLAGVSWAKSCPSDYTLDLNNNCIKVYPQQLSRFHALKTCQDEGAILYDVNNAFANTALQRLGGELGAFVWIGATCVTNNTDSCLDDEGKRLTYTNFGSFPPNSNLGACVQQQIYNGYWISVSCSDTTAPFVCMYTGNENVPSCDPGSWLFNGHCYRAVTSDYPYISEQLCASHDGTIVIINSIGENNFILDVASNSFGHDNNLPYFRIGMVIDNYNNPHWVTEEPVVYTNFGLNLPGKSCVDVALTDKEVVPRGKWLTATCNTVVPTICKKVATYPGIQPTRPSILCSTGNTVSNQVFYSPNYPENYVHEECSSLIETPGQKMYLQFPELYLDPKSSIKLYNDATSSTPYYTITHSNWPQQGYIFNSGYTKVEFDGENTSKSKARWRAISSTKGIPETYQYAPQFAPAGCNMLLTYSSQFTTNSYKPTDVSTGSSFPYPSGDPYPCNITFQAKSGIEPYRAAIVFNDFYIGPSDVVKFYDGKDSTANILGSFTGFSGAQPGFSIEATQQYLRMEVSAISKGYRGIWGTFYSN